MQLRILAEKDSSIRVQEIAGCLSSLAFLPFTAVCFDLYFKYYIYAFCGRNLMMSLKVAVSRDCLREMMRRLFLIWKELLA